MKWFDNTALTVVDHRCCELASDRYIPSGSYCLAFWKHVMALTYRLHDRRTVWTLPDQSFW